MKEFAMTDMENIGVKFTIGEKDMDGEVNEGFVFEDEDEKVGVTGGQEDDRESDYYSGSPVDSLKNAEDETEECQNAGKQHRSRTITQNSWKSKFSQKSLVSLNSQNWQSNFSSKQKWRDMTMGTSFVYAICLTILYLALSICEYLPAETVNSDTLRKFLMVMLSLSILALGSILTLSVLGKITNDEHYKKRGKSTFIRGGMLVLGTGMIIYSAMTVATFANTEVDCRSPLVVVTAVLIILFTVGEIAFLLVYNKIRINQSLVLSILGRYLMMQVIATNLCIWLGAIFLDTVEEIENQTEENSENGDVNQTVQTGIFMFNKIYDGSSEVEANSSCTENQLTITNILTPYLIPLMIEFSAMASCMCLAVWENCGNGLVKAPPVDQTENGNGSKNLANCDNDSLFTIAKSEASTAQHTATTTHQPSNYFNNNLGFVLGWIVIVGTVVITILVLYFLYANKNQEIKESLMFGLNMAISGVCLIALPFTLYKMSKLTFKDDEIKSLRANNQKGQLPKSSFKGIHRQTDKTLLFNTYIAMMILKLFVMISAYEAGETVIFLDGIVSIAFGFLQTLFINWYAFQKRVTTEEDRQEKPGRQGLEFLRCSNFALWLVNTFLLKNQKAKRVMYETFGFEAWAILSNIFQPLTILYYFHAMVCLSEVIGHTYTAKYVGVTRPWKRPKIRNGQISKSYSAVSLRNISSAKSSSAELTSF